MKQYHYKFNRLVPGRSCPASDREGSVVAVAILLLMVLSLSALMALTMTLNDSAMMRNNRDYRSMLYKAETALALAAQTHRDSWLAADSSLFDEADAGAEVVVDNFTLADKEGNDLPAMGRYRLTRIESDPGADSLSERFYHLGHRAPLKGRAGFSARDFERRRYGLLATGFDRRGNEGVSIEAGFSKIFNKF
ncbi:MAG: pilus assembly PilX N-terminal domain-containing protein [Desulfosudaceae bacterium]